MNQTTLDDIATLKKVFDDLAEIQERADTLLISIVDRRERGAQAAISRDLGIKPQSLPRRITAARNRLAGQDQDTD
ncbi:hypothetical protein QMK19_40995 [Streptomyces sp. H10-C2]|uniref:hypothetical protein n=1 Tax=unclassified Streptomyces TaxID=2593676 RepID=UPI0024B99F85|nr:MULTISPECIES: hypothetical protein [unclassified Streptomyces]MDJ0346810.1 hypothetical protein [Streptomyces sp. PH10-H1]MDJ0375776.1 hypothetical protein [Streptomyces sp. H10-C2]